MECHHTIGDPMISQEGNGCCALHEYHCGQEDGSGWYLDAEDMKYYVDSNGTEYYPDVAISVGQAKNHGIPYVLDEIGVPYFAEDEEDLSPIVRAALAEVDRFGEIPPNWDPFHNRKNSVPSPKELGYEDTSKHPSREINKRISIDTIATTTTELSSSSHPTEQDHGTKNTYSSDHEDAKPEPQSPDHPARATLEAPHDDQVAALPQTPRDEMKPTKDSKPKKKTKNLRSDIPTREELGYEDTFKSPSLGDSIVATQTHAGSSSCPLLQQDCHSIPITALDDAKPEPRSPNGSTRGVEVAPEEDKVTTPASQAPQEERAIKRTSKLTKKAKIHRKEETNKDAEQDGSQHNMEDGSRSQQRISSQTADLNDCSDSSTSFDELNASKESLASSSFDADGAESNQTALDASFASSTAQELESTLEHTCEEPEVCKPKKKMSGKRTSQQSDKPLKREPSSRGRKQKQEPLGMDDSAKSHGSAKSVTRKIRSESRRRRRETVLEKSERSRSSSVRSDRSRQRPAPLQPSGRSASVGPRRQSTYPANRQSYCNGEDDDEQGPPLTCPNLPSRRGRASMMRPSSRGSRRNLMGDNSISSRSSRSTCGPPLRRATSHQDISSRPPRGGEGPPLARQNSLVGAGARRGGFARSHGDRSRSQRSLMRQGYATVVDHHKKDEEAEVREQVIASACPIDPQNKVHTEKKEKGQVQEVSSSIIGLGSKGTRRTSVRTFGNVMASFAKTAVGATVNTATTVGHVGLATTQMAAGATMLVGKTAANVGLATTQVAAGATILVAKTAVNTTVGAAKLAAEAGKHTGHTKSQSLRNSLRESQTGQFTYVFEEGMADDLTSAEMLVKRHEANTQRPPAQTHQVTATTA